MRGTCTVTVVICNGLRNIVVWNERVSDTRIIWRNIWVSEKGNYCIFEYQCSGYLHYQFLIYLIASKSKASSHYKGEHRQTVTEDSSPQPVHMLYSICMSWMSRGICVGYWATCWLLTALDMWELLKLLRFALFPALQTRRSVHDRLGGRTTSGRGAVGRTARGTRAERGMLYKVAVTTGDKKGAGTDAKVRLHQYLLHLTLRYKYA